MKKIIFGLSICVTLSGFGSNVNMNQSEKVATLLDTESVTKVPTFVEQTNKIVPSSNFESSSKTDVFLNEIKELIFWLTKIRNLLLNERLQVNANQEAKSYLNDPTFMKFKQNLINFNKVMQSTKAHRNTIFGKGDEIFSDSNNQFFSSESIPSDLKNLYSNVLNAWEKIRYGTNPNEELDDFREKIKSLHQYVQNQNT